jgi:hypothetical protein
MIAATPVRQQFTSATVPLHRSYLRQASLFDERTYPLPNVLPGREAVITDADEWQDNFKGGTVIRYSYFTGLHTLRIESMLERDFYGREIIKKFTNS